jgi:hypothetical protein
MPADSAALCDNSSEPPSKRSSYQSAWPWIMCVVGLDYMSTLGYVPSIAFDTSGRLAPLAMAGLVAATLFGALPVYCYLAGRSPNGQGSLVLLERLIPGWFGKLLILILLGFAATDLIFTRTFSAADAAEHVLHSPEANWQQTIDQLSGQWEQGRQDLPRVAQRLSANWSSRQLIVTILLLGVGLIIGVVFRKGFRKRFIQIAVGTVAVYAALNALLIGFGMVFLLERPELIEHWRNAVFAGDWQARSVSANGPVDGAALGAAALALFPKVALGLSGFEMAMLLMPLIRGRPNDDSDRPKGRIRNTRKLLVISALTMSAFLLTSSLVTTILIPPEAFRADGGAKNRALAYLAHGGALAGLPAEERIAPFVGLTFGTIYDLSTIAILCLAGVSVSLCLVELVPPYLHRLGMEFEWVHKIGALIYVFTALKIAITFYYQADVDEQRSAYTTSVLVIFASSALAVCLDIWRRREGRSLIWRVPFWFGLIAALFLFSTAQTIWTQPGGASLSLWFIAFVLVSSILTRFYRSTELRFKGFEFADEASREAYEKLKVADFPILVPHRPGNWSLAEKEAEIRARHRLGHEIPLVFVIAELGDSSDFFHRPRLEVKREDGRVIIHVCHCVSVAHVIAAVAIDMSRVGIAPEVHFGWSEENPITANLHFVLFGHGNVPWMVYTLLRQSDLPEKQRPRVVVG